MSAMPAAAMFGMLFGIVLAMSDRLLGPTLASVLIWSWLAIMSGRMSVLVLERTGLRLTSIGMAGGALLSTAVVIAALLGTPWRDLVSRYWFLVGPLVFVAPGLMFLDRRQHRAEFDRWSAHQEQCTLLDLLMLRHIPDLRASNPEPSSKF